jgi:hypothetical protein
MTKINIKNLKEDFSTTDPENAWEVDEQLIADCSKFQGVVALLNTCPM